MMRGIGRRLGRQWRLGLLTAGALALAVGAAVGAQERAASVTGSLGFLPNNFPHLNPSGLSSTFSTEGFIVKGRRIGRGMILLNELY